MKLPKPKAIIFDWDNTLVDSWPVIHRALEETFIKLGAKPWTIEETKVHVGKSMRDHFPALFGERWEEAGKIYTKAYRDRNLDTMEALPQAKDLLEFLQSKDLYIAVVSNKTGVILRQEADHMGLTKYFKKLVGATDAKRDKPFPDPLLLALKGTGIEADKHVWFVGDSMTDVECAVNSGCTPIFYGDGKVAEEFEDKVFYIDNHGHLRDLIHEHS